MSTHILVIPFHGHGHLFPSIELCKRLSSSYKITLIVPSSLSSSLPDHHPLFQISTLTPPSSQPESDPPNNHHHDPRRQDLAQPFTDLLTTLFNGSDPPKCAIIDVMVHWAHQPCKKFNIPTMSFYTSSACTASIEFAMGKLSPENLTPGEPLLLPGLPDHICVTQTNLTHLTPPHHPNSGPPKPGFGPPFRPGPPISTGPGNRPAWVSHLEISIALMINACPDLERPFVEYLSKEIDKPVFSMGPLLPEQFSRSDGSVVHDRDLRSKRDQTNYSEDEINQWLDSKPRGSVIFVSFGSEVGPTFDELAELAIALDECNRPFIWVMQSDSSRPGPHGPFSSPSNMEVVSNGFVERVKGRGLIIRGWAPQLLILSHRSTGGFVSHGGWNSTLEAILRGVPLLMWPICRDQHYNAKLIVDHLKVGLMIKVDAHGNQIEQLKKGDILIGIEKLIANEDIRKQAVSLASTFEHGLSSSYMATLDALNDFLNQIVE